MNEKRKPMKCPNCTQEVIPEFTDAYLANQKNIENEDIETYVKMKMDRSFDYKCPECNEKFDIPPEMMEMQCPECKKTMKPRYTDRYLKEKREHKLKGISLTNDELQCPECNAVFHYAVEFVPWTGPKSGLEITWEKTRGWFRKFLP